MASILLGTKFYAVDGNGLPLVGGKVYTYQAGTTTPKTSYTDSSETTPNTNPVILDSRGTANIWINGTYKIKITDANDVLIDEEDNINNDRGAQGLSGTFQIAVAGGTADAITANYTPDITLSDTVTVAFRAIATNTSATPTFSPDGLTPRNITKFDGGALVAGDIITGGIYVLTYNLANTRWEIVASSAMNGVTVYNGNNGTTLAASSSAVTPYTLRFPAALGSGGFINFDSSGIGTFTTPSTGAVTLVATKTATAAGSVQLAPADLGTISGSMYMIELRGFRPGTTGTNLRFNLRTVAGGVYNLVTVVGQETKPSAITYVNTSGVIAYSVNQLSSGLASCYSRVWLPVNLSGTYTYGKFESMYETGAGNAFCTGMFLFDTSSSPWNGFSFDLSTGNFSTTPAAIVDVFRFA